MRQVAVFVISVLIGLLHGILEGEAIVISRGGGSVVHPCHLVAPQRIGQVVEQAVGGRAGLAVTLQALDVAVQVIGCHLLRETVGVGGYVRPLAVGRRGQAVQAIVGELVAACRGLVPRLPRHAADVAAVLGRAGARVVVQALREFPTADACQPATDVVAVRQLVRRAAVGGLRVQETQLVVGVGHQGHFGPAVQLVPHGGQAACVVIRVSVGLRLRGLPAGGVYPPPLHGVACEVIGHILHVRAAQVVRAPGLDDAAPVVVEAHAVNHGILQRHARKRVAVEGVRGIFQHHFNNAAERKFKDKAYICAH